MDFVMTIKLAKNVFDLYIKSRGHYENILNEVKKVIENSLICKRYKIWRILDIALFVVKI